jgi:uncharacterized membrane protein
MWQLVLGLLLLLGIHSVSIVAPAFRDRMAAKSEWGWKIIYSIFSLAGIVLIVRGYGEMRLSPVVLYVLPDWFRYVTAVLLLPVFILFFAPYFPGRIKKAAKNPQLVSVKLWAAAHLLVNGTLAGVLLFGSFLAWAVADRISLKRRRTRPVPAAPESAFNDVILVLLGLGAYVLMAFWLHHAWFGTAPLGISM